MIGRGDPSLPDTGTYGTRASTARVSLLGFAERIALAAIFVFVASLLVPALAGADPGSLYQGAAPRPGPDILYEPVADAPQLQNAGNWGAAPILVSGASAYRDGEFLYQDFLYDDHGAKGSTDPADPRTAEDTFSKPAGTYTYPTATATYANNAADLVELRVEPLATDTAFRITLNTLLDSNVIGATIAIGGTPGTLRAWPYSANVRSPAQYFLTVHGTTTPGVVAADLRDALTGLPVLGSAPSASLDVTRRQVTVTVPHSTWNPGTATVRLAAGVGIWNATTSAYRVPANTRSATQGGGSGTLVNPPALYNLAFRFSEPMPEVTDPPGTAQTAAWWRDKAQGLALGSGTLLATADISQFSANVDFSKLAAQVDDDMPGQPGGVPQTGPMDRILASHFEPSQGANFASGFAYQGQLQPYALYVPVQPMPADGYGMTLLLHSLAANYNQYLDSNNQSQFGERGAGSIVLTTESRGPDGSYVNHAEVDVFEAWADVARHYTLDPEWTTTNGYSMGAIGSFRLAERFPDLFSKIQPTVGYDAHGFTENLRNIPVLMWNVLLDELVGPELYVPTQQALDSLGYRYELDVYPSAEHLTLAINDEYGPAAVFLGTTEVDRDPAHVTYSFDPADDNGALQLVGDHAYWAYDITPAASGTAGVDVFSRGFGTGDPPASATQTGSGTLTGGSIGPLAYTSQFKTWGATPAIPVENKLDISATNVSSITINATRAKVTCGAELNFLSSPPHPTVNLVDCPPDGYARPQSATPASISLVPAYEDCGETADSMHGAPLAAPSCSAPAQTSAFLTVGSPDANGKPAISAGKLGLKVVGESPIIPSNGDQANIEITMNITDVRKQSDLSDYTGELRAVLGLRVTDRDNGSQLVSPATVEDTPFEFNVSCSPTLGSEGGACNIATTADAVMTDVVREGKRSIWGLSQVQVFDGGADGDADTAGDNTLFAVQGLFAP
jgi:hypothetical protein